MGTSKVKIVTSEYNETKDLIFWTLLDLEKNTEQTYCWPSKDYLKSVVGFSDKAISLITPEILNDHCKKMLGKELFFEVQGDAHVEPQVDPAKQKSVENDIQKMQKDVNDFVQSVHSSAKEATGLDIDRGL